MSEVGRCSGEVVDVLTRRASVSIIQWLIVFPPIAVHWEQCDLMICTCIRLADLRTCTCT